MFEPKPQPQPQRDPSAPTGRRVSRWGRLRRWWLIARQRRELALLNDHLLADIGISRDDAEREARRPFWDDAGVNGRYGGDSRFGYRFHGHLARLLHGR